VSENGGKVSVVIVCYNEEENIERCLRSVTWADEIVVVDSFSTDKTVDICKEYTERVYQRKWAGHIQQKEYVISLAKNKWVFAIDSDEVVTDELRDEIFARLATDQNRCDGYFVKRHTFYLGKWINHGGWYPDYKLRLFKKDKVYLGGENPHDKYFVDGKAVKLRGKINHYTYRNIADHLATIDSFSDIASDELLKRNNSLTLLRMLFKPPTKFFETFVYKLGVLDGIPGFIISVLTSYYIFLKYAKVWEKKRGLHG
jgi:glycosyltransferase involved in cell wall biosynthesis